jgi:hypothetical protein
MRYKWACFAGFTSVAAVCIYPVAGFNGVKSRESGIDADAAVSFASCDDRLTRKLRCDGRPSQLWGRQPSSEISEAASPMRGRPADGYTVWPEPKERCSMETSVLLCTQYSIALQQCFMALQGVKSEKEPELLAMFQACLKGRNFPAEPSVCRRNRDSLAEPGR